MRPKLAYDISLWIIICTDHFGHIQFLINKAFYYPVLFPDIQMTDTCQITRTGFEVK